MIDPVFGEYQAMAGPGYRMEDHLGLRGSRLYFKGPCQEDGLFVVGYKHGIQDNHNLGEHSHDFFEVILGLGGAGEYQVAFPGPGAPVTHPFGGGDIIFVHHQCPHRLFSKGPPFSLLNICFTPSALGLEDRLLGEPEVARYFSLLGPFFAPLDRPHPVVLRPPETEFRRILRLALHLAELDRASPRGSRDLRRHMLHVLLLLLQPAIKVPVRDEAHEGVQAVLVYLNRHYGEKVGLAQIAAGVGLSPNYLSSLFRRVLGRTLSQTLQQIRLDKARELLTQTALPVSRVHREVGFENLSHFSHLFRKTYGASPQGFRKNKGI